MSKFPVDAPKSKVVKCPPNISCIPAFLRANLFRQASTSASGENLQDGQDKIKKQDARSKHNNL
jgi:hypothetical protein